jgi:hypothetical protein
MIVVDVTPGRYHIYCMTPPLASVPRGDFFCYLCLQALQATPPRPPARRPCLHRRRRKSRLQAQQTRRAFSAVRLVPWRFRIASRVPRPARTPTRAAQRLSRGTEAVQDANQSGRLSPPAKRRAEEPLPARRARHAPSREGFVEWESSSGDGGGWGSQAIEDTRWDRTRELAGQRKILPYIDPGLTDLSGSQVLKKVSLISLTHKNFLNLATA